MWNRNSISSRKGTDVKIPTVKDDFMYFFQMNGYRYNHNSI